jgi:pimeloyl-ACP methyl ester carboxylesterase
LVAAIRQRAGKIISHHHRVRRHLLHGPAAYEATLRQIRVPVLVTHGMEDRVALVPMARYTESVVANAQVSLYEGVGHIRFGKMRQDLTVSSPNS